MKHFILNSKKAEMGIGTLIIFIALIFVASIAANVLIQTSFSLQSKALDTAKSTKNAVATRIDFLSILATDGTDNNIENFYAQVRLAPGSEGIKLDKLSINLLLSNMTANYVYSNEACTNVSDSSGDGFYVDSANENGTFTVQYIQKASNHRDGVLARGEIVKICFRSPRSINEDEKISIRLTPKSGFMTEKQMITDSVITDKNIMLFP